MMHIRYRKYLLAAFIIFPMSMVMAFVGVMRNYGFAEGWFVKFITTWMTMFPIAYLASTIIIPVAEKMIARIRFRE